MTTQLHLSFNTNISTEDQSVHLAVDSLEHAQQILTRIGFDRVNEAEVYELVEHDGETLQRTLYVLLLTTLVDISTLPIL